MTIAKGTIVSGGGSSGGSGRCFCSDHLNESGDGVVTVVVAVVAVMLKRKVVVGLKGVFLNKSEQGMAQSARVLCQRKTIGLTWHHFDSGYRIRFHHPIPAKGAHPTNNSSNIYPP